MKSKKEKFYKLYAPDDLPKYVVVKKSRRGSNRTYTGPTWAVAGLETPPDGFFLETATYDAEVLSHFNPVGFVVELYKPYEEEK